jgi:hypothetical protein
VELSVLHILFDLLDSCPYAGFFPKQELNSPKERALIEGEANFKQGFGP